MPGNFEKRQRTVEALLSTEALVDSLKKKLEIAIRFADSADSSIDVHMQELNPSDVEARSEFEQHRLVVGVLWQRIEEAQHALETPDAPVRAQISASIKALDEALGEVEPLMGLGNSGL